MMNFTGLLRLEQGTASARRLRKQEQIPVVLYIKGKKNLLLSIEHKIIFYADQSKDFYESPMSLEWINEAGSKEQCNVVIKEIQRHPFKNSILHVDFAAV